MMPPITAAIRTPNAPTPPPRSSAAGGLEKLEDPDGFVGDPVDAGFEAPVVEDVLLVEPGLADADEADAADAVVPDGFAELAPEVAVAEEEPADVAERGVASRLAPGVDPGVEAPGLEEVELEPAGFVSAGFLSAGGVVPVLGTLVAAPEAPELPGFSFTFSAFRSIVTGRLEPALEALDGFAPLAGLSEEPLPLPPEEDVPPEDFLSVAICSPPEPSGHSLYTPRSEAVLVRHVFVALQNNDSTGSG